MTVAFGSIKPGEIDDFQFDFTKRIGTATIVNSVWTCEVAPYSGVQDPTPQNRLIGGPVNAGSTTAQRFGNGINGVTYWLTANVVLSDGRDLDELGELACTTEPVPVSLTLSVDQFRADFPVFADDSKFTDESLTFWINIASLQVNQRRFGDLFVYAQELFVAHQAMLEAQALLSMRRNGLAIGTGPSSSRSVNGVSVSYDFALGAEQNAGYYNLTIYGQRFYALMRMAGAGPIQLTGFSDATFPFPGGGGIF